jgi:hypothetical protein
MPSKKLASLIRSVPPATARADPEITPVAPVAQRPPIPRPPAPAPLLPLNDEPEVPLQALIPPRIREELGIMMAKERVSLRALILRSVRGLGIGGNGGGNRGRRGQVVIINS